MKSSSKDFTSRPPHDSFNLMSLRNPHLTINRPNHAPYFNFFQQPHFPNNADKNMLAVLYSNFIKLQQQQHRFLVHQQQQLISHQQQQQQGSSKNYQQQQESLDRCKIMDMSISPPQHLQSLLFLNSLAAASLTSQTPDQLQRQQLFQLHQMLNKHAPKNGWFVAERKDLGIHLRRCGFVLKCCKTCFNYFPFC